MRIVLVGDFGRSMDEGMRNVCYNLAVELSKYHLILRVNTRDFLALNTLVKIYRFRPQIIQYITGPTLRSLIFLKISKILVPESTMTIATGMRPYFSRFSRRLLHFLKPDVFLSQAPLWENVFRKAGAQIEAFPNSVDCTKFTPVDYKTKEELRKKYNLSVYKKIILHVGHIKPNRNLNIFKNFIGLDDYIVLIIGSKSHSESQMLNELRKKNILLITDFQKDIQEFYQLADFYVFTVDPLAPDEFPNDYNSIGVIDFPLSILEAMACNLPVISTEHQALIHFNLNHADGFSFFNNTFHDLLEKLHSVEIAEVNTRKVALKFDKEFIARRLSNFFIEVASGQEHKENCIFNWN